MVINVIIQKHTGEDDGSLCYTYGRASTFTSDNPIGQKALLIITKPCSVCTDSCVATYSWFNDLLLL